MSFFFPESTFSGSTSGSTTGTTGVNASQFGLKYPYVRRERGPRVPYRQW